MEAAILRPESQTEFCAFKLFNPRRAAEALKKLS